MLICPLQNCLEAKCPNAGDGLLIPRGWSQTEGSDRMLYEIGLLPRIGSFCKEIIMGLFSFFCVASLGGAHLQKEPYTLPLSSIVGLIE